jgi:TldD protein
MQLDAAALSSILRQSLAAGDYADAFYERRVSRSFRLQDGHIHEAGISLTAGVGVRVISGQRSGYAHTDDLSPDSLRNTARVAGLIARDRNTGEGSVALAATGGTREDCYGPLEARTLRTGSATYVDLLQRADAAARAFDPRIVAVNATLADELQDVIILTADGTLVSDRRPLVTLSVQCVAQGAARANGTCGDGGRTNLDYFLERSPESIAIEAARVATVNSDAIEAPAGELEVVVGPGSGGVLLHEAVGHGLEGDFNRHGTSLYSGRIGERVASELVTIYDDGNLPEERGSISVDDEGTPGQHKVLVENGILRGYMQDRLNGSLMGMPSTGSGRRQSFRYLPQPRMCNTYMAGGESTHDEIVASVKRGLYAKSFAGGQVEISKGDFVFMLAEGYLIEDGKLTTPIRGASLIGNGPEVMTRVVMTGNDAQFAGRSYTCGKGGQSVPVGVGMPTVKLSRVTVGGSALG